MHISLMLLLITSAIAAFGETTNDLKEAESLWNAMPSHQGLFQDRKQPSDERFQLAGKEVEVATAGFIAAQKSSPQERDRWLDRLANALHTRREFFYFMQTGPTGYMGQSYTPKKQGAEWQDYVDQTKKLSESTPVVDALIQRQKKVNDKQTRAGYLSALESLTDNPKARSVTEGLLVDNGVGWNARRLLAERAMIPERASVQSTTQAIRTYLDPLLKKAEKDGSDPFTSNSPEAYQRRALLEAMTKLKDPSLVTYYWKLAKNHPTPSIRERALNQLYGVQGSNSVGVYRSSFEKETDPAIRRTAAILLGKSKDLESGKALLRALSDPQAEVREGAMMAVGDLGMKAAIPSSRKFCRRRTVRSSRGPPFTVCLECIRSIRKLSLSWSI